MTVNRLRVLLRMIALVAGFVWAFLCWRAIAAPESHTASGGRALAFSVMLCAGMLGSRPPREGDDGDESL